MGVIFELDLNQLMSYIEILILFSQNHFEKVKEKKKE